MAASKLASTLVKKGQCNIPLSNLIIRNVELPHEVFLNTHSWEQQKINKTKTDEEGKKRRVWKQVNNNSFIFFPPGKK